MINQITIRMSEKIDEKSKNTKGRNLKMMKNYIYHMTTIEVLTKKNKTSRTR